MKLVKTPKILKWLYPKSTIWHIKTTEKALYLTFDDGPTPIITPWVLQVLKRYNAKATFFCIGKNVVQHPRIYQQILKQGHSLANHTHNHYHAQEHTFLAYYHNIIRAKKHIQSNLFRPPYGKISPCAIKKLEEKGFQVILWDLLSRDFDSTISKEKCLDNVLQHAKKGSIIVFHDSKKAAEKLQYALPKVLQHFSQRGYVFKAIV